MTGSDGLTPEEFAKQGDQPAAEVAELKRRVRSLEKQVQRYKADAQQVRDIIDEVFAEPLEFALPTPPQREHRPLHETPVLHITDVQGGKVTDSYDTVVAEERLMQAARTTMRIADIRRTAAQLDHLRLYLGGDILEGEGIFPGQGHETDPSSVYLQACRVMPTILVRMVLLLLTAFDTIRICCVPGNHGRTGRKGDGFSPLTNWDSVCYHTLGLALLGHDDMPNEPMRERVEFVQAEDAFHVHDLVYDWGNFIVHGDKGIYSALGMPHYAIQRRVMGWAEVMAMVGEPFDYVWMGHFHTQLSFDVNSKVVLLTGSPESDNQFARSHLAAASFPTQRLAIFTEKHGLISDHRLYLSERLPARRRHELWA